jgi:hypothetical protein
VPSFSLGCGPQAGNITSDNITARHLVNIKRVAFPTGDWKERERKAHERAAAMTGAGMPRGSMMDGDPGHRGSSAPVPDLPAAPAPTPRVPGGPSFTPPAPPVVSARPVEPAHRPAPPVVKAPAASTAAGPDPTKVGGLGSAPRFTADRPGAAAPQPAGRAAAPAAAPTASVQAESGASLSASEIEKMLENAGSGCPLGPCQGCPHHDVQSHTCTA